MVSSSVSDGKISSSDADAMTDCCLTTLSAGRAAGDVAGAAGAAGDAAGDAAGEAAGEAAGDAAGEAAGEAAGDAAGVLVMSRCCTALSDCTVRLFPVSCAATVSHDGGVPDECARARVDLLADFLDGALDRDPVDVRAGGPAFTLRTCTSCTTSSSPATARVGQAAR